MTSQNVNPGALLLNAADCHGVDIWCVYTQKRQPDNLSKKRTSEEEAWQTPDDMDNNYSTILIQERHTHKST